MVAVGHTELILNILYFLKYNQCTTPLMIILCSDTNWYTITLEGLKLFLVLIRVTGVSWHIKSPTDQLFIKARHYLKLNCLFNNKFKLIAKKTIKLKITSPVWWESTNRDQLTFPNRYPLKKKVEFQIQTSHEFTSRDPIWQVNNVLHNHYLGTTPTTCHGLNLGEISLMHLCISSGQYVRAAIIQSHIVMYRFVAAKIRVLTLKMVSGYVS